MEIVITDLTRFKKPEKVCIAGISIDTGECIRPLPYMTFQECKKLKILPGSKLKGKFTKSNSRGYPHIEDSYYENLKPTGASTSDEFQEALEKAITTSIADGFGYQFPEGGKVIPYDKQPRQSIVTIKVNPSQVRIVEDSYNPEKIKLNFQDNDSKKYTYLPITDLGFYNYALKHFKDSNFPKNINDFMDSQDKLYLRIGLSGRYKSNERDGYWLQINGIYTFPNFDSEIRSYS